MDIARVQAGATGTSNFGVAHGVTDPTSQAGAASERQLIQAVKAVNGSELFGDNTELTFVLDRQTHRTLVRVVDKRTREVKLQIPPENVLRIAEERKSL
jgi:flagellar protein FlaG